ncbi:helix-turn-helix transcriptional regulator [Kitasatospora sp. NPDC059747]|uniref:helix-turn-helix transcriptional regulator n=1 Tax=Kitasatospora sp. NPDC059747 TaxID=3346930 RepID=UPI00364C614E
MTQDMPARMLRLLSLLQTRREWSGAELATRLGVTGRTVRRDIDRLRELGYPVEGTTGHAGGYRLAAGTDLPPLLLDDEEAIAAAVALRTATSGVTGIEDTALRALTKLEQVFPARLRHRVAALQAVTVPLAPGGGPRADPAALATLAAACRDHEIVTFDHRAKHATDATARRVEPHALVAAGSRWYLVAYDLGKDAWRTFRVDRLSAPAPTGHRVPARELPGGDPAAHVAATIAAAPARYTARATVPEPAETVRARTGALPDRLHALDAHTTTVDLSADDPLHIAAQLLTLGPTATLHGPSELAPHIEELGRQLLRAARALSAADDKQPDR